MSTNMSNLTTGFVDLTTYDELEKHMYGGNDSIAYFDVKLVNNMVHT